MGSGFKNFVAGNVLTEADLDGYLMRQTIMTFADTSARDVALSSVLDEGMVAYSEASNSFAYYDGSSWITLSLPLTAYTPTLGGFAIGNGTVSAFYSVTNTMCYVFAVITTGSTTTYGSTPTLTLPVATSATAGFVWLDGTAQQSASSGMFPVGWRLTSSSVVQAILPTASGTYVQYGADISATAPFTWAAADYLTIRGWYPIL